MVRLSKRVSFHRHHHCHHPPYPLVLEECLHQQTQGRVHHRPLTCDVTSAGKYWQDCCGTIDCFYNQSWWALLQNDRQQQTVYSVICKLSDSILHSYRLLISTLLCREIFIILSQKFKMCTTYLPKHT